MTFMILSCVPCWQQYWILVVLGQVWATAVLQIAPPTLAWEPAHRRPQIHAMSRHRLDHDATRNKKHQKQVSKRSSRTGTGLSIQYCYKITQVLQYQSVPFHRVYAESKWCARSRGSSAVPSKVWNSTWVFRWRKNDKNGCRLVVLREMTLRDFHSQFLPMMSKFHCS